MKKWTAAICALLLLLLASSSMAEEALRITSVETLDNGNVLVKWTDPGNNGPYYVGYQYIDGDQAYSFQLEDRDITVKSLEIVTLAPGETYDIYVLDQQYHEAVKRYSSETQLFGGKGSGARLTFTPRQKRGGAVSTIDSFSLSAIKSTLNSKNDFFGATIKATPGSVSRGVKGVTRLAVRQPDGDMFVFVLELDAKILPSYDYIYYDSVSLSFLWNYLENHNDGGLQTGTYDVSLYLNRDTFGWKEFTITK